MYQNDPMKVLTGEVRLSYVSLTEPRVPKQGGEAKYSATLLIPKSDYATKADIDASIQAAAQAALTKVWGGVRPPQINVPIHDGDGVRQSGEPYGEECKGHWVITANTKMKPQVVGMDNTYVELAPSDIYSGMYARVTLRFFGYSNSGKKGVGCGLGNVMKTRDGEALARTASAASDFATVGNAIVQPQDNTAAWGVPAAASAAPAYQQPTATAPAYQQPAAPAPMYQPPTTPAYQPQPGEINPFTGLPY